MIGSRVRPVRRARSLFAGSVFALCIGVAGVVGVSAIAHAQSSGPIKLLPSAPASASGTNTDTPAPMKDPSLPATPVPVQQAPSSTPTVSSDGSITLAPVGRVLVDSIGILSGLQDGLGEELWKDTPGADAVRLVTLLSDRSQSSVITDLKRRLLLTSAPAPLDLTPEGSLLELRVQQALRLGLIEDLQALEAWVPDSSMTPELTELFAEAAFYAGRDEHACALAQSMVGVSEAPYWVKAGMVCDLMTGNHAKVEFAARLLVELKDEDALIQALGQSASLAGVTIAESLEAAGGVHMALMRVGQYETTAAVDESLSTPVFAALASGNGRLTIRRRLLAAEFAERLELTPKTTLFALYGSAQIPYTDLDSALASGESEYPPLARAILWRAGAEQTVGLARAQTIESAFQRASNGAEWRQTARLFKPLLDTLQPDPDLDGIAELAVRLYLSVGDVAAAQPWLDRMRRQALSQNEEMMAAWLRLWPLMVVSGEVVAPYQKVDLDKWFAALKEADPEGATGKALTLLSLLDALGMEIDPGLWRSVVAAPSSEQKRVPNLALRHALDTAHEQKHLGEVVTLAAAIIGTEDLTSLDPSALSAIVGAFMAVGLEPEAWHLVREAVIDLGI